MRRSILLLVLAGLVLAVPRAASAQVDAKQAFASGKAAYGKGQFEQARDLFLSASRTDNRNPEVFLWLGKAQYQLGALNDAVAAWRTTLRLAPKEPYAAKMLQALRGELTRVDVRIGLVEAMLKERLFATALSQCGRLLADKALTDAQRAKVAMLQADALVETNRAGEAISTIREVLARWPKQADPARTTLILGRAKVRLGGAAIAEGRALLEKVLADHAGTPAAATAQYELLVLRLGRTVDAAGAAAL